VDNLTPEQRSVAMSRIRARDTKPELIVRQVVHRLGFRLRLHRRDVPGCPDLVLPRHNKIIFVHGCFWHRHDCRCGRVIPKTNVVCWRDKRQLNRRRDRRSLTLLRKQGWRVLVVWECWTRSKTSLTSRIQRFLLGE
jgi:DNA mismatch endonuclease (patch repair protein)